MSEEPFHVRKDGPMHGWFGLTYSNYLVLPRALIQSMPTELQERLCQVLKEMRGLFQDVPQADRYEVRVRVGRRYGADPVPHYRRAPDLTKALAGT